jgi:hypothetical protein
VVEHERERYIDTEAANFSSCRFSQRGSSYVVKPVERSPTASHSIIQLGHHHHHHRHRHSSSHTYPPHTPAYHAQPPPLRRSVSHTHPPSSHKPQTRPKVQQVTLPRQRARLGINSRIRNSTARVSGRHCSLPKPRLPKRGGGGKGNGLYLPRSLLRADLF